MVDLYENEITLILITCHLSIFLLKKILYLFFKVWKFYNTYTYFFWGRRFDTFISNRAYMMIITFSIAACIDNSHHIITFSIVAYIDNSRHIK